MDAATKRFIKNIINTQSDLTLATLREDGYPQANTVSYANDGLTIYFGTGRDSQKVKNIQHCDKVSLTIDPPYADLNEIKGLSMGGIGEVLADDSAESRRAIEILTKKYPAVLDMPPPGGPGAVVFVKISPEVVSVLDYKKGFGHTELVRVDASELHDW